MKRMLIDASHPEETRVAVLDGNQLEEFDVESSSRKQLKGNIYLAKVTRVEPSLQAAFVDYGGNRHGFLAFNEIHPDYYQIPVADRERLMAEQAEDDAEAERAEEAQEQADERAQERTGERGEERAEQQAHDQGDEHAHAHGFAHEHEQAHEHEPDHEHEQTSGEAIPAAMPQGESVEREVAEDDDAEDRPEGAIIESVETYGPAKPVETLGGDEMDDAGEQRRPSQRAMRRYKIQEVIKRRQVLLIQVVKEERGNKGAALTTYLSLAGRYCVLMPNTGTGGGISRKIGQGQDRKRLKSIISDLEVPPGMAMIVRTAGADRGKAEIKRDYDYLLRLWNDIRNLTLASSAPALIHGEASIINRAIRDLYTRDIEEVVVEGDEAYRMAKDLMKMLIPSHAKKVQAYKDDANVPLFSHYGIENQLESMNSPTVQLKSGGYIVMNATEALVAIDVNSGRATRGRNIEETALKTNTEAATEIARQLRLRDLAGLIVIDFIDMDHTRNQQAVERRLKEAMRRDRARIQIGRISPFGLLELSRQRLRPSLAETVTDVCPHCGGTGILRSTESTALHVLRGIEEEVMKRRAREVTVAMPTGVALYLLNHKRMHINDLEAKFDTRVIITADDSLIPPKYTIERTQNMRDDAEGSEAVEGTRERPERAQRPERNERHERNERNDRGDRQERGERSERSDRHERGPRPEREPRDEHRDAAPRPDGGDAAANEEGGARRRRRRRGRRRGNENQPGEERRVANGAGAPEGEERRITNVGAPRAFDQDRGFEDDDNASRHVEVSGGAREATDIGVAGDSDDDDGMPILPGAPAGDPARRRRGRRGGRGRNRGRREDGEQPRNEGPRIAGESQLDADSGETDADAETAGETTLPGAAGEGGRRRRRVRRRHGPRDSEPGQPETGLPAAASVVAAAPTLWAASESTFEPAEPHEAQSASAQTYQEPAAPAYQSAYEPAEPAPQPMPQVAPVTAPPVAPPQVAEEAPAGPPRRGWWQKLME